ncbi:hypothetical protein ES703_61380 [subsurface metagenome]
MPLCLSEVSVEFGFSDNGRDERDFVAIAEIKQPLIKNQRVDSISKAGKINITTALDGVAGVVLPLIIVTGPGVFIV